MILQNIYLRSLRYLPEIFTQNLMAGAGETTNYYRPIPLTVFLLGYQIWGPSPLGYHILNILCHTANALLLARWAFSLSGKTWLAFSAAFLFLIHPLQTETVNYADHLEGMLAMFFGLLTLSSSSRPMALIFWALCLLSKEEGVVFFPILAAGQWIAQGRSRQIWVRLAPFAWILGAYVVLRLTVFNFLDLPPWRFAPQKDFDPTPLPLRLLTFAKALAIYLRLLVWPAGLHFDRWIPFAHWASWSYWLSAAGDILALAALWKCVRKHPEGRLGWFWFVLGFLPVYGLIPFNNPIAEHFTYIPSAGFFLMISILLKGVWNFKPSPTWRGLLLGLGCAVLIFFTLQTLRRNQDWRDPIRLYETTLAGNPKSFRAANNLGVEYFRKNQMEPAALLLERSLHIQPAYAPALNNLGVLWETRGNLRLAGEYYLRSALSQPDYALAHKNLAGIYLKFGKIAEAQSEAEKALEIHPQYVDAWLILASAFYQQKRFLEAKWVLEKALSLEPENPRIRANLEIVLKAIKS